MKIFEFAYQNLSAFDPHRVALTRKSPSTLVVDMDRTASDVARLMDLNNPRMVFVVDTVDQLRGIVSPTYTWDILSGKYGLKPLSLSDAIVQFQMRRQAIGDFDWANVQPTMLWCDKGSHLTDRLPCPDHP